MHGTTALAAPMRMTDWILVSQQLLQINTEILLQQG
jgi:hypothetical protein